MTRYDVLIVGGGHGGAQAAIALRQLGFTGSVAIVGAEPLPPYERPPLSKDFLAGEKAFERMLIRPAAFWDERGIALMLGQPVVSVDPETHRVTLADGDRLLLWDSDLGGRRNAASPVLRRRRARPRHPQPCRRRADPRRAVRRTSASR